jgi:hypothetical protein
MRERFGFWLMALGTRVIRRSARMFPKEAK